MLNIQFGEYDCETPNDFQQYHRYRYFGVRRKDTGHVCPCWYQEIGNRAVILSAYSAETDEVLSENVSFSDLNKLGCFGMPILGNVNIGPSFAYLSTSPKRESIKGISLKAIKFNFPEHGRLTATSTPLMDMWLRKNKDYYDALYGREFGHLSEARIIDKIYNREYLSTTSAFNALESGERIGCAISHKTGLFLDTEKESIQVLYRGEEVGQLIRPNRYEFDVELDSRYKYLTNIIHGEVNKTHG